MQPNTQIYHTLTKLLVVPLPGLVLEVVLVQMLDLLPVVTPLMLYLPTNPMVLLVFQLMGMWEEERKDLFSQLLKKLLEVMGLGTKKEVLKEYVLMEANQMILLLFQIVPLILLEEAKVPRMVGIVWMVEVVVQVQREELGVELGETVIPPLPLVLLEEKKLVRMVEVVWTVEVVVQVQREELGAKLGETVIPPHPLDLLEEKKLARMLEVVRMKVVVIQMEREGLDAKEEEAVVPLVLLALLEETKLAWMVGVV